MIDAIEIRGFKRFEQERIPFRSLTLLTGLNGAGKSTTIQAILLMRAASLTSNNRIPLNGQFGLALGETSGILNANSDPHDGIGLEFKMANLPLTSWGFNLGQDDDAHRLSIDITSCPDIIPSIISGPGRNFAYLCAERLGPRDGLSPDSIGSEQVGVGVQGEFTAQVLAQLDRYLVPEHRRIEDSGIPPTLQHQVESWVSKIVRPIQIKAEWIQGTSITTLRFRSPGDSEWIRPYNTGFGISYALPIIVAGLTVMPGGILIVENPEAHLHPAGQSMMAGFLARVAKDDVQVIVETHSDHILNGLRRAIGEDKILPHTDASVLFFDQVEDKKPTITEIRFSPTGALDQWPARFFDQYQIDVAALSRARRSRSNL